MGTMDATPPPGTGRGLGRWSKPVGEGGAGVRVMEAGRGRKGSLDRKTLGSTSTWSQVKDYKVGQTEGGSQV